MKFVLASHGDFAKGLLSSVQMLLGAQEDIEAFGLYPEEQAQRLGERLEEAIKNEPEGSVVFFTDLYFGSPFNQVVELAHTHDIYHITGTNLPVLIEAVVARNGGASCEEVCRVAVKAAEGSVLDVRQALSEDTDQADQEEEEW